MGSRARQCCSVRCKDRSDLWPEKSGGRLCRNEGVRTQAVVSGHVHNRDQARAVGIDLEHRTGCLCRGIQELRRFGAVRFPRPAKARVRERGRRVLSGERSPLPPRFARRPLPAARGEANFPDARKPSIPLEIQPDRCSSGLLLAVRLVHAQPTPLRSHRRLAWLPIPLSFGATWCILGPCEQKRENHGAWATKPSGQFRQARAGCALALSRARRTSVAHTQRHHHPGPR
jgi:hypothetical protein